MNSLVATKKIQQPVSNAEQRFQFQFTSPGSALPLTSLESLEDPDLLEWMDNLQTTSQLCQWSEETAVITLKTIVHSSVLTLIENK